MRRRFDPWVGKIPWRRAETHSGILTWTIPRTEEPGRVAKSRSNINSFILLPLRNGA